MFLSKTNCWGNASGFWFLYQNLALIFGTVFVNFVSKYLAKFDQNSSLDFGLDFPAFIAHNLDTLLAAGVHTLGANKKIDHWNFLAILLAILARVLCHRGEPNWVHLYWAKYWERKHYQGQIQRSWLDKLHLQKG